MAEHDQQHLTPRRAQASAMLLSLLFSLWLAIGSAVGGPIGPAAPEIERYAAPKAVVVQAGPGKQAQQPRQPDPAPALPGSAIPILAERLTYPAGAVALAVAAPLSSAAALSYQARAPPAR